MLGMEIAQTAPRESGQEVFMRSVLCACAGVLGWAGAAVASIPPYSVVGTFLLPTGGSVFDAGADGRLFAVDESGHVLRQNTVNGSAWTPLGSLSAGSLPSFGPGFVHPSPDGTRLAIGDNGNADHVLIVQVSALNTAIPTTPQGIAVPNFDGAWTASGQMYINGGPFGSPSLWRVDVTAGTAAAVVTGLGDASGGVAARAGRVYTGIGLDLSGARTGEVRSFDLGSLNSAPSPVTFFTGLLAATANSASALAFDAAGNLIIAGSGGVAVFELSTSQRYDLPRLSPSGFYSAVFDNATGEILVRDFGSPTVERFAVPSPGVLLVGVFGAALSGRRKRA